MQDVGEVCLLLSDPSAQILPIQQVQEQAQLTHQLLHRCIANIQTVRMQYDNNPLLCVQYIHTAQFDSHSLLQQLQPVLMMNNRPNLKFV